MLRLFVGFSILGMAASVALGQGFEYTARYSFLEIEGDISFGDGFYDFIDIEDPDFGPFDELRDAEEEDPERSIRAQARQMCVLDDLTLTANGEAYGRAFDDYGLGHAWARADSALDISFEFSRKAHVVLTGQLTRFSSGDAPRELTASLSLDFEGSPVYTATGATALAFEQELEEGSYRLTVAVHVLSDLGNGGGDAYITGRAGFDLQLQIIPPPYGDFDSDGDVDAADYAMFFECFRGPDLPPFPQPPITPQDCTIIFDDNADGDVDLQDFSRFQMEFTGAVP